MFDDLLGGHRTPTGTVCPGKWACVNFHPSLQMSAKEEGGMRRPTRSPVGALMCPAMWDKIHLALQHGPYVSLGIGVLVMWARLTLVFPPAGGENHGPHRSTDYLGSPEVGSRHADSLTRQDIPRASRCSPRKQFTDLIPHMTLGILKVQRKTCGLAD